MDWKMSAAFAVVSFFGVGSLVYLLLHKDEENEDILLHKTSKTTVVEIKIPVQSVGSVIGKKGNTVKEIEIKSNTTIKIVDDTISADFKIGVIRGTNECVQYAQFLIQAIITNQSEIEIFEMYVPSIACGRIIGKRGKNIRMIHKNSKAKLTLESPETSSKMLEKKLVIEGTSEQINLARILVEQIIEVEKTCRIEIENLVPYGHHHKTSRHLLPAKEEQKEASSCKLKEVSIVNAKNDLLEVYLSAIESPDRFWLQKLGHWSANLINLIDEMTDYYSKEENKEFHKLKNLELGQIVAAPLSDYSRWFRAKILDIQIESDAKEPEILLYKVDFGETEKCQKKDVHKLHADFLDLKFQAIECMLAKVKPRDSTWSQEAINYLKGQKHVGKWHSITAKVVKYKERPVGTMKEKRLIPCVELYDTHEHKVVNMAEVLVEKGLAVWEEEEEEVKSSGVENLLSVLGRKETVAETSHPL